MAKMKILLIDDEGDLLELVSSRLKASGYRVMTLDSGERVMQVAKSEKPDLILLDVVMPGKGGCDVCRELKADEATRDIPVIVFTALDDASDINKSMEIGATDYMVKASLSPDEVVEKIKKHLK